jgi:uncharacterized NAD(P)/FAD-binding protein YdhS
MDIADISFIGSGAAATTTLIELFNKLIYDSSAREKLHITVVEKYAEFWKGIPYGSRSSVNSLTITAVSDFISTGKEKYLFFNWLKVNHDKWTSYYRETGGNAAATWLKKNLPLLESNEWHAIYLPRYVFGIYMHDKMLGLLQTVKEKHLAQITLIQAEAIDVKLNDQGFYEVVLEHPDKTGATIATKKLVIATGSAPVKNNMELTKSNASFAYINELYEPSLDDNLRTLQNTLAETSNATDRNVLIIGSNASCIELLYLLNHRPDILNAMNKVVTISQTGLMPGHISHAAFDDYPCKNLDQLKAVGNYTIHTLIEATKKDIEPAIQHKVIIPYVDRVIGYTIELMQVLDEDSKKIFFGIHGPQLTRLIRRSGPAYKGSSDDLIASQKLQLLKGRFLNIEPALQGGLLNYTDPDNHPQQYPLPFKLVINCSGSDDLQNSSSRLIYSLVQQKICSINLSGKGFLVNEKFEAAPNLYIIGPLLGGNMNKRIHFWHLESLSRLLYLSPYLAEHLLSE